MNSQFTAEEIRKGISEGTFQFFPKTNVVPECWKYFSEAKKDDNESNPLNFWCSKRKKMPILAHIAATIFVKQASSAESERHYSAFNARHIITPIRNRICPDVVEAMSINWESYKNSLF